MTTPKGTSYDKVIQALVDKQAKGVNWNKSIDRTVLWNLKMQKHGYLRGYEDGKTAARENSIST